MYGVKKLIFKQQTNNDKKAEKATKHNKRTTKTNFNTPWQP